MKLSKAGCLLSIIRLSDATLSPPAKPTYLSHSQLQSCTDPPGGTTSCHSHIPQFLMYRSAAIAIGHAQVQRGQLRKLLQLIICGPFHSQEARPHLGCHQTFFIDETNLFQRKDNTNTMQPCNPTKRPRPLEKKPPSPLHNGGRLLQTIRQNRKKKADSLVMHSTFQFSITSFSFPLNKARHRAQASTT